jgi:hypothetical protein
MGNLLRQLLDQNALSSNEKGILADMTALLNNGVHGAEVDQRAAQWAIEMGIPGSKWLYNCGGQPPGPRDLSLWSQSRDH